MGDSSIAVIMVFVAIALVALFLRIKRDSSERRMLRMARRCGVDPKFIRQHRDDPVVKDVRRRCRRCQSEGVCERWLAGRVIGENDFCPNAQVFEDLRKAGVT